MALKKEVIGGVKWTAVASIFSAIIQLAQIAILSRYLNKSDFGLMALALFVIGISQIFVDMGISNAIIHKQRVNKFQLNTLFWLNIVFGVCIYGLISSFAPLIAKFYNTPSLKGVLRTIGVTFLIIPFGQIFGTLLRRDLKFQALSSRDILGKVVGFFVSVILAISHFGVYSLVYGNLASAVISTALLIISGFKAFRPQFIFSWRSLSKKGFFSFGLFQIGEQFVNYFNSQFDTVLIGKLLGMEALGIYNVAKTLAFRPYQMLNPIITKVAFPVFAKFQNDIAKLRASYLRMIESLTILNAPIYGCLIVFSEPIIKVFFGSEWLAAIPILQLLSVSALMNSIGNPVGSLQLARGRADLGFYWNLVLFTLMPLSMYIGSSQGIIGVAYSIAILKLILQVPAWYFFVRPLCNANFGEYFVSIGKPLVLASIASGLAFIPMIFKLSSSYQIVASFVVFISVYGLMLNITHHSVLKEYLLFVAKKK
ncbi:MAG: MOP flippase family protein [Chitinophagaceae bacterium]|nr:MOP flippase family protein [Chitinophagaceae bacterium]